MATDLDALDEIFSEPAAKKVRTGVKFQPKAKPRPRKESSAVVVDVGENKKPSLVGSGSETLKNEKSLKNNEDFVSGVHSSDDRAVVNPSLEHFVAGESLGSGAGLPSDVSPHVNGLHFTIGKSAGESADIFSGLESLDDFYSQSTTTSTEGAVNRSPKEVDLSVHLRNDLSTSCPVNNDAEGILAHSEIPTVRDSDNRIVEEEPVIPVVSHLNVSAVGVSNASSPYQSADFTIAQDPLTCGDSASCESGVPHINTRCVEIEDAEANPCLETLFELTTQSGKRRGKFKPKPKPKAQIDREKPGGMTSRPQGYESVPCCQNAQYVPSESEYINEASIPAMPTNDLLNFSSLRFDDTSSQIPEIEEPMYPGETSEKIVSPRTKSRKRKRRKVPVVSSDHQQASISGPENEADDDENYVYESPSGSHIHEDESFDGKLQELKTTKKRKVPRKSNKSATQKEKPVRKRKKAKEVPDPASKEPPKKFSHSTKRKRRQVDKALLDTPEDEIDVTKLCMRDLILLAEHRERISSKEGKTSEVPSTLHSAGTSYAGYNEDETFASEQGGLSDDQTIPIVQESSTYTNYQTYMNKTPRSRWSKQDTELFYEALRQFGSDISMIQQLFPGRSRTQVKLKYKKEERQNPLRLHEALTTRSKAENANKRPRREPAYVRTTEINRVLQYTGEPGTRTAGRGRDASVLLGYDPAYRGFTDRRLAHPSISTASTSTVPQQPNTRLNAGVTIAGPSSEIPVSEGVPLPRVVLRRSSRRQTAPSQQTEQSALILDTSQSSSLGYSRSPRDSGTMSRQPLNLSTLLTVSSRGRGASNRVASTGHPPSPPRRNRGGSTRTTPSPRDHESSLEAGDAHRDKRPRDHDVLDTEAQVAVPLNQPQTPSTQVIPQTWAPQLIRGNRPVNIGDSASSSETALALAQSLLLPVDMQKESTSPSDRLVSTGLVSGIKFIQKMVTLGQKYQEAEAERIRLLNNNTSLLRSVARLEGERDKAKADATEAKGKLETAEDSLNQALAEIDGTKKAAFEDGYQKGFDAATAEYVEQMPGIQDQIWISSWEACLTKIGAADDSPFWEDNDLPSKRATNSHELEEPLVDDVDQEIDDFVDADENIQVESEGAHAVSQDTDLQQSSVEEITTEPINLEEEQTTEGGTNTNVPSIEFSENQNLD